MTLHKMIHKLMCRRHMCAAEVLNMDIVANRAAIFCIEILTKNFEFCVVGITTFFES